MHLDTAGTESIRLSTEKSTKLKSRWKLEVGAWGGGTFPAEIKMVKKSKSVTVKHEREKKKSSPNQKLSWRSGIRGLVDTHSPLEPHVFKKPSPVS